MSTQPMTEAEQMRRTIDRVVEEMLNGPNLDVIPQFYTEGFTWHGPGGREMTGLDATREMVGGYLAAFPDLQFTVEQKVAEGDRIASYFRVTGTHDGPLEDIAPTGKKIDIAGLIISRFEGRKIAEEWEVFDELRMLQPIGVVPE